MPFLTLNEARAAFQQSRTVTFTDMHKSAGTILRENNQRVQKADRYDVFLSHSSEDAEVIAGVKAILEKRNLTVYVDWTDESLDRNHVTPGTAAILRERMRASESLVFATSKTSPDSKWMPWELGYFDGIKPNRVAVLPLVEHGSHDFKGQEYVGLYPVIQNLTVTGGGKDLGILTEPTVYTPVERFAKSGVAKYYTVR